MNSAWLRNAFAIDPAGPALPRDAERAAVDWLCNEIVRRDLAVPALAFLGLSHPLNGLAANALHFFVPLLSSLSTSETPTRFAEFLERRGSVEYLCRRIEELSQQPLPSQVPPHVS